MGIGRMRLELLVRRRMVWKKVGGRRPFRASRVCFSGYWADSIFIDLGRTQLLIRRIATMMAMMTIRTTRTMSR